MIDPRWERIEQLFFGAAELSGGDRENYLASECGADAELRREVESLLATDATAGAAIGSLVEETIQDAADTILGAGDSMEGTRLGPWVILREIGRGGMGAVYLAERADAEFRKQVAIKLVKRGIDTDAVLHRFLHERQILAGLEHPNIAGLLDGGTSPDGRPYFVMEYVEGVPIQAFCQQHKLTVRQRCELFRKVCEPVSYAHRNLVIHRDLKPANILVRANGEPKLLDFGIARLVTTEVGEHTIGIDAGVRPFTPGYASPEQLRGEAVNTTTDVYSLGAVLAKLLEGMPGDRDLENIVLKATHADAGRRYASVDQLSDDLGRYLTGRPVVARGDDWTYAAGKFIRRNRVAVTASALFALMLTAGIVTVLWEARQAQIQKQRAEERLGELVEMANQTLLKVNGSIERLPGSTAARREMVKATFDYLDRLNRETGNDQRILAAMASAYVRLAGIEGHPLQPNLGDYKGAEQGYRKAAKILDDLIAGNPSNIALRMERADCAEELGQVLDSAAQTVDVIAEASRGLDVIGYVLDKEPGNLTARKRAATLHLLRISANSLPDTARAKAEAEEQLPIDEKLAADYPNDPDCILALASLYSEIGDVASREGRTRDSLAAYQTGVKLRERVFAIQPNDVVVERDLMMSYGHIGDMLGSPFLFNLGDSEGAIENYRKAEKIAGNMVVADASNRQAKVDLGIVLGRIGAAMQDRAQAKESLEALGRSAEILEQLLKATPNDVSTSTQLAVVYEYQGRRRFAGGDNAGAKLSYQRSDQICDPVVKAHPEHQPCGRQLTINDGQLAHLAALAGDRALAVELAGKSLARGRAVAEGNRAGVMYLPRALGWSGDVYHTLAADKSASAAQRAADEAQAASLYGQAAAAWRAVPDELRKNYTSDEKRVQSLAASLGSGRRK